MYWPLDGHQCITMWMPLVDIVPSMGGPDLRHRLARRGALSDVTISDASEAHFDALIAERGFALAEPQPMRPVTRPSTRGGRSTGRAETPPRRCGR